MEKHRHIETGIREHRSGLEAYVTVSGRRITRYFKYGTALPVMRRWREEARLHATWELMDAREQPKQFPRSPDGWCYLYIVRRGGTVKIGRAADIHERIRNLQTAHSEEITLIGATPIHASLEPEIHKRLEQWRTKGEWYEIDGDVVRLMQIVKAHANPVLFVWPEAARDIGFALQEGRAEIT